MTNPDQDYLATVIIYDADLRDGKLDSIITEDNFTAAINDADRADGVNSRGKGDGNITKEGLEQSISTQRQAAHRETILGNGDLDDDLARHQMYMIASLSIDEKFGNSNPNVSESYIRAYAKQQAESNILTIKP